MVEDAFETRYRKDRAKDRDWLEMLQDPKARRDDVSVRMLEMHHDQFAHNVN